MTLTSEQITKLRREKVRECRRKGYTQRDIANELQIALGLVNKDIKWLVKQADNNIKNFTDVYLPAEHERCLDTLDAIIKEMWLLEPNDNRERIQSRTLIKDCAIMRLELVGSGKTIERAVRFINKQKELGLNQSQDSDSIESQTDDISPGSQ